MGLDWNPLAKPKPGFEAEFEELFRRSPNGSDGLTKDELERFQTISSAPYELLGAPRLGLDPEADKWLLGRPTEQGDAEKFDQAREAMKGLWVLDLLPKCDGFPLYTNYGAYEGLERYSFRGSFLRDAEHVLGPALLERAYQNQLAEGLSVFGDALLGVAREYAINSGVAHIEHAPTVEFQEESPSSIAHILFSAAKWCRYWSSRGHGLEVWY